MRCDKKRGQFMYCGIKGKDTCCIIIFIGYIMH